LKKPASAINIPPPDPPPEIGGVDIFITFPTKLNAAVVRLITVSLTTFIALAVKLKDARLRSMIVWPPRLIALAVIGNLVLGGVVGISMVGVTRTGGRVFGNIVRNSYGRGIDLGQDSTIAAGNTLVGGGQNVTGILHNNTGATGNQIRNNIVKNFVTGITLTTGCDEDYNCIHGHTTDVSGATIGTNSITSDPLLDYHQNLMENSPCIDNNDVLNWLMMLL